MQCASKRLVSYDKSNGNHKLGESERRVHHYFGKQNEINKLLKKAAHMNGIMHYAFFVLVVTYHRPNEILTVNTILNLEGFK